MSGPVARRAVTLAAETRAAVRARPFLLAALRAGVVNYAAAADHLAAGAALDGDRDAIAAALRRFAADLPDREPPAGDATVSMRRGLDLVSADADGGEAGDREPLLRVGPARITAGGDGTAAIATGDVDPAALSTAIGRLDAEDADVRAAGVAGDALVVVVGRRDGPDAVRILESVLSP